MMHNINMAYSIFCIKMVQKIEKRMKMVHDNVEMLFDTVT